MPSQPHPPRVPSGLRPTLLRWPCGRVQLPEVESARAIIAQHLAGRRIVNAVAGEDAILFCGPGQAAVVATALVGRTIVGAGRKGKYFWFELDQRPWPLMHFGMSGQGHLTGVAAPQYKVKVNATRALEDWPPRYVKLELELDDGRRWAFTDPRRLGRIRLVQDPISEPPVSLLGFDPYLNMPTLDGFRGWLAGRKAPIKAVLLDQTVAAGVGNWIADEVCYQARVHPDLPVPLLDDAEVAALHEALERIVRVAVACKLGGQDMPSEWLIHYRWSKGAKSPRDHYGNAITFCTVGGRTSAVVAALQKLRKTAQRPVAAAAATPVSSSLPSFTPPVGKRSRGAQGVADAVAVAALWDAETAMPVADARRRSARAAAAAAAAITSDGPLRTAPPAGDASARPTRKRFTATPTASMPKRARRG